MIPAEVKKDADPGAHDAFSLKEIKVRIPVSYHLKLHAFKVLKGKPISDTIVEALDAYFRAAEARRPQAQAAQPVREAEAGEAHSP